MPGRRAVPFVVAAPRKAKRGKKREKGGEEGWLEATTYRGRGQRGEGRRKGRKTGRRRGDWPFIFVVPPGSAACSRKGGQNSGDPLWPAFIATTPKGAFIFISIMGHRDVYAPRSALSLRSFIIINSTTGPPPPPPLHQDFRRFLRPPSPPPPLPPSLYLRSYLSSRNPSPKSWSWRMSLLICLPRFRRLFTKSADRSAMQIKEYLKILIERLQRMYVQYECRI